MFEANAEKSNLAKAKIIKLCRSV